MCEIECSTLLAQVAKTSQGLIPPSFWISSAKVQDNLMKCKCKGVLSVISYQLSVIRFGYVSQTTVNRQLEPRTKNKDCVVLIEIFCFFHTSYFMPQTTRAKNQEQRLFSANWNFLLFSDLIPHTSDLKQQTTDNWIKKKGYESYLRVV